MKRDSEIRWKWRKCPSLQYSNRLNRIDDQKYIIGMTVTIRGIEINIIWKKQAGKKIKSETKEITTAKMAMEKFMGDMKVENKETRGCLLKY